MTRLILLFLLIFAGNLVAQEKQTQSSPSSFDGTWMLNRKNSSNLPSAFPKQDCFWNVRSTSDSLTIDMDVYYFTAHSRLSLVLDKVTLILQPNSDSEANRLTFGKTAVVIRSKTKLSKDKLTREYTTRTPLLPNSKETELIEDISEKYTLSKDGNRLTFESISQHSNIPSLPSPHTVLPVKLVFDRKN